MFIARAPIQQSVMKAKSRISAAQRAAQDKLWNLGSRIGTSTQLSISRGLKQFKSRTKVESLMGALANQDVEAVLRLIPFHLLSDDLSDLSDSIEDGMLVGAKFASETLPSIVRGEINFNASNPRIGRYIERHVGKLVVEIGNDQRQAIQSTIIEAFKHAMPPRESAKLIKDTVGLNSRLAGAVTNYKLKLQEQGVSATRIGQLTGGYADRLLDYRAKTIARTETAFALNGGQMELWEQAMDQGLFMMAEAERVWVIDPVTAKGCPICEPMDGQTIRFYGFFMTGLGEPIQNAPAHPSCNCLPMLSIKGET